MGRSDIAGWLQRAVNWVAETPDALLHGGRLKDDTSVTFKGGPTLRRIERGKTVRWSVDGMPVTEQEVRACVERRERELAARPAWLGD